MAPGEGRKEVPDSEDEPMTSSPVAYMDGAADKLFATARVPLQDAQDAPTEPAHAHQATAEDHANVPGTRLVGLDDDQHNASYDVDAKNGHGTNLYPIPTAAEQAQLTEPNDAIHISNVQNTSHSQQDAVDMPSQRHASSPKMSPSRHGDHECDAEHAPDLATTNKNHPVHARNIDGTDQDEASNHATQSPIADPIHVMPPVGSNKDDSAMQDTVANDLSKDNVHFSNVKNAQMNIFSSQTAAHSFPHASDTSRHTYVEEADLKPDTHDNRNDQSLGAIDDVRPENRGQKSETPTPAFASSDGILMAVRDNYPTMPVSPSISTDVETQQSSQVGGSAFPLDEDIGRDAVVPSPRRDPPQVVNVKIESHQRDNDPSTSSSFVSAASSTSRPASTRETEVDFTIKDTLSVAKTSPAATEPATNSGEATTPNVPAIARTPQEITLAELKAQKAAMLAALAALPAIQVLMEENAASDVGCGSDDEPTESDIMTAANKIVKDHIKLLHEYNELKDVGQGLMGLIADQRGVRIIEIQEEFGIEAND